MSIHRQTNCAQKRRLRKSPWLEQYSYLLSENAVNIIIAKCRECSSTLSPPGHAPDLDAVLLAVWTPLKTKLSRLPYNCEFVCTTEQRNRSREKAREGHRSSATLHSCTCNCAVTPSLILWLAHCILCKQQLISCRLQLA